VLSQQVCFAGLCSDSRKINNALRTRSTSAEWRPFNFAASENSGEDQSWRYEHKDRFRSLKGTLRETLPLLWQEATLQTQFLQTDLCRHSARPPALIARLLRVREAVAPPTLPVTPVIAYMRFLICSSYLFLLQCLQRSRGDSRSATYLRESARVQIALPIHNMLDRNCQETRRGQESIPCLPYSGVV